MEDFFRRAIRERNMIEETNDEQKRVALEELRLRRDYLRKFKSEEEIEEELCRVCNHNKIDTL